MKSILALVFLLLFWGCSKDSPNKPGDKINKGQSYFVATMGNDENDGSFEKPWQTIHYGVTKLAAGDTLTLLEGTYRIDKMIPIRQQGKEYQIIVIQGEPGKRVALDAKPANIAWGSAYPYVQGTIQIENAQYIKLKNIELWNNHMAGINIANSSHIDIVNCKITNSFCSGISAWQECEYINILGNTVVNANDEKWSWSTFTGDEPPHEAISMAGPHFFEIAWNHVYNCQKEGIDVKETASFGTVHHNYVHDCNRQGLYIDGWFGELRDIEMFENVVTGCEAGIAVSSEEGPNTRDLYIHHNIIYHNRATGIFFSRWGADNPRENVRVINNTFYQNGWGRGYTGDPDYWLTGGCYLFTTNLSDVIIRNNIFAHNKPFEIGRSGDYQDGDFESQNIIIDYNLIQDINTVDNPFYMKTWTKDWVYSIKGEHSLDADPLFVQTDAADFRLAANSPARNAGHPDADFANADGSRNTLGAVQGSYFTQYYWWKSDFPSVIE